MQYNEKPTANCLVKQKRKIATERAENNAANGSPESSRFYKLSMLLNAGLNDERREDDEEWTAVCGQWRRQRSKGARSFRGQKILKPGQVTQSPGRCEGLA